MGDCAISMPALAFSEGKILGNLAITQDYRKYTQMISILKSACQPCTPTGRAATNLEI
jgi:hypothetical protein